MTVHSSFFVRGRKVLLTPALCIAEVFTNIQGVDTKNRQTHINALCAGSYVLCKDS